MEKRQRPVDLFRPATGETNGAALGQGFPFSDSCRSDVKTALKRFEYNLALHNGHHLINGESEKSEQAEPPGLSKADVNIDENDPSISKGCAGDSSCMHCGANEMTLCWHRIWSNYQFRIATGVCSVYSFMLSLFCFCGSSFHCLLSLSQNL
ncbi:unnamed protein product [Protopolystoma xenopodis]|uniref:Uncharacterized protein n=1 Tax=Protopolystoma xenopodis TaxID=117903 RepID=A0A448X3Q3_9PLAT|nr:unnamed protein product [Protopolystoma xenopodis]